ncbi:site-specific DNA-methyltransferase [Paraburkholderia sp. J67]|uniref:site-specific DNA-methyltransferase n=1 Tax=Paraburkholderia sp. J67 TaxID=2805435 RepID=UPI002ABE2E2F|nr:site-specific DNA-methyltransferase [Paraburkholderia sp. J67]
MWADAIEQRPVAALTAYARNARTHSEAQLVQLQDSMRKWGFTIPVLVAEDDTIIAGHGRVEAARRLGYERVPVIVARGWSAQEIRAYVLADNKLAENAGWDDALLVSELEALTLDGFAIGLAGFSESDMDRLLKGSRGRDDEDEVPPVPAQAVTAPGDVWVLGAHRLVCGDSTDAGIAATALGGVRPSLMITDPPYGVDYDADWRNRVVMVEGESRGQHGSRATGRVLNDTKADWREAWAHFPGDVAYVWHAGIYADVVAESLHACRFDIRAQIIWAKQTFVISRGHYHWQHEPCWYAVREGKTASWTGDRSQSTLWQIDHRRSESGHSTQKPVEAMRRPIENHTSPGQAVYEPFSGSGTTIIAAESVGRACHAIELNPGYCDVAVLRWQTATRQNAVRERDGLTFAQAAEAAGIEVSNGTQTTADGAETGSGDVPGTRGKPAGSPAAAGKANGARASRRNRKDRVATHG